MWGLQIKGFNPLDPQEDVYTMLLQWFGKGLITFHVNYRNDGNMEKMIWRLLYFTTNE